MPPAGPFPPPGPEQEPGFGPPPPEGAPGAGSQEVPGRQPPTREGLPTSNNPELPPPPGTPTEAMNEALTGVYYALEDRLAANPHPTQHELDMGVFEEEIQPQVRDAILLMREKGYDTGNVLHAGFLHKDPEQQTMNLFTPLSEGEVSLLQANGFVVEESRLSFRPEDSTDLGGVKSTWDLLASLLPDRGEPAGPALFGNAVKFREAAAKGTLMDYYLPDGPGGELDMVGTKYLRERDPFADSELFLSPDVTSATRELTYIDQYHELKDRLTHNPVPTEEELNIGAYVEELEPQVRAAVVVLRNKGYNTGSSGFWGEGHIDQVMNIATPIDNNTRARLAEHDIRVTDGKIHFTPEQPSNLEAVKQTWDMIADIVPDLGRHAEPADNQGAVVFRYATERGRYNDYLENWVWQSGALNGLMAPLAITLYREGRNFGPDVYEPARLAEARYHEMVAQASREK